MHPPQHPNSSGPAFTQHNVPNSGGTVYSYQGTGAQIINHTTKATRRRRIDTWILLSVLVVDIGFFFYGMEAYSGRNTHGDEWRAVIFLVLLATTIGMIKRWIRRRT